MSQGGACGEWIRQTPRARLGGEAAKRAARGRFGVKQARFGVRQFNIRCIMYYANTSLILLMLFAPL
jgi:hypothetical protein